MRRVIERDLTGRAPAVIVAALESAWYMRNQLLRDTDWASMTHSLEIRTPLVDIELLRTVAPIVPRLTASTGKRALAAAPSTPLPSAIVDRPKTGFAVPTGRWLASSVGQTIGRKGAASRLWARQILSQNAA